MVKNQFNAAIFVALDLSSFSRFLSDGSTTTTRLDERPQFTVERHLRELRIVRRARVAPRHAELELRCHGERATAN